MFKKASPATVLRATFVFAAAVSFVLSISLYFRAGDDELQRLSGIYVGLWVPSILSLGALLVGGMKRPGE